LNQSPLFYAARDGRRAVVEYLLSNGAVASDIDRNGQTPLFYAARENRIEICRLLIHSGASVDHRDLTGRRPSYFSRLNNHTELTSILESFRKEDSDTEDVKRRKRYRVVFVGSDGSYLTPTVQQMEELESKFPEICVWDKSDFIATSLVTSALPAASSARPSIGSTSATRPGVKKAVSSTSAPAVPKPIWMTAARQIVSDIFKKEDAWIFLRPVDPVKDQCADYFTVIKSPMDFGTIRRKISKYSEKAEFITDCQLVFSNCRTYNKPGTLPAVLCERVDAYFRQLLEQYSFDAIPDSAGTPSKAASVEAQSGADEIMTSDQL
jgi:hypothetical protein